MRTRVARKTSALALVGLLAGPTAALAAPDISPRYPSEHQQALRVAGASPAPYAMNYTDEAARTLGVNNGRWEAFDTGSAGNALMPALKAGIDSGGAMVKLQWRPGE